MGRLLLVADRSCDYYNFINIYFTDGMQGKIYPSENILYDENMMTVKDKLWNSI